MNSVSLQPFSIKRPEKIAWRFPSSCPEVLDCLKSKGLKKFLATIDTSLAQNGITVEYKTITEEEYTNWLPYYREKMAENEFEVLANEEWYSKKKAADLEVEGMFFYQNGNLVGSGIFTKHGSEKATFAFKASDRIELTNQPNSSLGAAIDYLFLKEMVKKNIAIISGGRSRNAFGVINTFGYLDYKMKFRYMPYITPDSEMLEDVPVNKDGLVLFFGESNGKLIMYGLKPKGNTFTFEISRFASEELPFTVIEY